MIEGTFRFATGAQVRISVRLDADRVAEFDATIDTGFDGALTLPLSAIQRLGLHRNGRTAVTLGTGVVEWLDLYLATVVWAGQERRVDVFVADTFPLIGLSLLSGHYLGIEVADGGRVEIRPLKPLQ